MHNNKIIKQQVIAARVSKTTHFVLKTTQKLGFLFFILRRFLKNIVIDKLTSSGFDFHCIQYETKRYLCHEANIIRSREICTFLTRKKSPHLSCCFFLFVIRSDKGNARLSFDKSGFHCTLIHLPTAILLIESFISFPMHTDISITDWYRNILWQYDIRLLRSAESAAENLFENWMILLHEDRDENFIAIYLSKLTATC